MANRNLKARVANKHDKESNWKLATNFSPMDGELIVYDKDENYSYNRIKIGDGTTNVNDLPFANQILTEETVLDALIEEDMLIAVKDSDGYILTDGNGDILSM